MCGDHFVSLLKIDREVVSEMLRELAIGRSTVGRNRKRLYDLCKRSAVHPATMTLSNPDTLVKVS